MKASDIFFRLMQAATERGIGQCVDRLWERQHDDNGGILCHDIPTNPRAMCVVGLESWGLSQELITRDESLKLNTALPGNRIDLNNIEGWTFPDFYEYLKDREAESPKAESPKAEPARVKRLDSQAKVA